MPCASGMHHQSGVRKLMHEFTRAAGMVQMYVGEEYVGHIRGRKVFFLRSAFITPVTEDEVPVSTSAAWPFSRIR